MEGVGAQQLAPLGRPAVNSSQSNCAHFLDARLELFWAENWSALWAMVRAECDVAPIQNMTRRKDKQQMQSRVRKVATLARTGEKVTDRQQLRYLGKAASLTASAVGDKSLMWVCHITRTPGCSTPSVHNQHSPGVTTVVALKGSAIIH